MFEKEGAYDLMRNKTFYLLKNSFSTPPPTPETQLARSVPYLRIGAKSHRENVSDISRHCSMDKQDHRSSARDGFAQRVVIHLRVMLDQGRNPPFTLP